ncbi:GTPase [Salinimicrobium soli]|uniref:GTPase n=2 Tax=Bacteria TaxID=2 RepID=UPI003AAC8F24
MQNEEFTQEKYEEALKKSFDEKQEEFDDLRSKKLVISLIGSVNAGKSQTINALTGINYADVKARSGWTKEVTLYPLNENVLIADTPGLNDINESVSQKATNFVEESADIILYFLNANVGITAADKKTYRELQKLQKEIIVIANKIDTLDDEEINEVRSQIFEELGVNPFCISAKKKIGLEPLHEHILSILETRGKDILYIKASKFKNKEVRNWINAASATAVGIGALPVPGSDIIPLTTLQVGLAMKIAFIYDIKPSKEDVMKLAASTVTGSIGKQIAKWAITGLKAAGWIPGAQLLEVAICGIAGAVAGSMTYGFGWACNAYYSSGMQMELNEVGKLFKEYYDMHRSKKKAA